MTDGYLNFICSHVHSGPHGIPHVPALVQLEAVFNFINSFNFFRVDRVVVHPSVVMTSKNSLNLYGRTRQIRSVHKTSISLLNLSRKCTKNQMYPSRTTC